MKWPHDRRSSIFLTRFRSWSHGVSCKWPRGAKFWFPKVLIVQLTNRWGAFYPHSFLLDASVSDRPKAKICPLSESEIWNLLHTRSEHYLALISRHLPLHYNKCLSVNIWFHKGKQAHPKSLNNFIVTQSWYIFHNGKYCPVPSSICLCRAGSRGAPWNGMPVQHRACNHRLWQIKDASKT